MDGAANILALMLGSMLMGMLGGVYYLLHQSPVLLATGTAVLVPVCWLVARQLRRMHVPCPATGED